MKNTNKKLWIVTIISVILAISCIVSTVAYIAVKTDTITNTFTSGNVSITLTETTGANYKMIPNVELAKDPTVTVEAGSEASYVFVRVVADDKAIAALDFSINVYVAETNETGWKKLDDVDNVYYIESADLSGVGAVDATYSVLKDNKVTVKDLGADALAANAGATIAITAFAVQKAEIDTVAEAWAIAAALES